MKPFCPCCGYDLVLDQPILLNDFAMLSPLSNLSYKGNPIQLTDVQKQICWALMKACPEPVRNSVVIERAGSDGSTDNIKVQVCLIRRRLRAAGAPDPFEACRHRGGGSYRWKL